MGMKFLCFLSNILYCWVSCWSCLWSLFLLVFLLVVLVLVKRCFCVFMIFFNCVVGLVIGVVV